MNNHNTTNHNMYCHMPDAMCQEEKIKEKIDDKGNKWTKVYFGGGAHFQNWLNQFIEIHGEENVEVEEIDTTGLKCYDEGGEKACRIWVRNR